MSLPPVLVADTNIWIDLENGGILPAVFQLPYQFIIADLAVDELGPASWAKLQRFGLQTRPLSRQGMAELTQLRKSHHQLSLVDLAAMLVAQALEVTLLTGDRRLTALAQARSLTTHGVLWVMDLVVDDQLLTPSQAVSALMEITNRGARLPEDECQKRLMRWLADQKGF